MIKIITSALILIGCSSICFADNSHATLQTFVPQDWKIIAQASGDLNKDGMNDFAMIIQPENKSQLDRKLLILFQNHQQFHLNSTRKISDWTYHQDDKCLEDALDETALTIKNQLLNLQFNTSPSCTNTYGLIYTYRFKLEKKQFHLVGFESYSLDNINGKQNEISLNFLTQKAKLTTIPNIFSENKIPSKTQWKAFKSKIKYTLQNIPFDSE